MRLPVDTAATAGGPSEPTIFVSMKPTSDSSRLDRIAGQASVQMPSAGPSERVGWLNLALRRGGTSRRMVAANADGARRGALRSCAGVSVRTTLLACVAACAAAL